VHYKITSIELRNESFPFWNYALVAHKILVWTSGFIDTALDWEYNWLWII
jgi:hypothetical protein